MKLNCKLQIGRLARLLIPYLVSLAVAGLHKVMSKIEITPAMALGKQDDNYTESGVEQAELLVMTYFPHGMRINVSVSHTIMPARADWDIANTTSTLRRLKWAVKPYNSPVLNRIFLDLLKEGKEEIISDLLSIARSSLALEYISQLWRKVKVMFIPK